MNKKISSIRTIHAVFLESEHSDIVRIKDQLGLNTTWHDAIISAFRALENEMHLEKIKSNNIL